MDTYTAISTNDLLVEMWCHVIIPSFFNFVFTLFSLFLPFPFSVACLFAFGSQQYLDALVAPITRAIYDQELDIQAFAGDVSLVSIATTAYWVTNGNSQLPKVCFFIIFFCGELN